MVNRHTEEPSVGPNGEASAVLRKNDRHTLPKNNID